MGYPDQHGEECGQEEEQGDIQVGEERVAKETLAKVFLVGGIICCGVGVLQWSLCFCAAAGVCVGAAAGIFACLFLASHCVLSN